MRATILTLAFTVLGLVVASATAHGQAVQLPTFSMFAVETTVLAPDSGGAQLGGVRRGSYSIDSFGGIPRNRGWGITRQASGVGVTVQIHDPDEAEAALRGSLVRRHDAVPGPARPLRIAAGDAASDAPLASIAEIERQRAAQAAAGQQEAIALVEKARLAQQAGKTGVAAIYLRSAARRATGALRETIERELRSLETSATAARATSAPRTAETKK
jgi:hypothetical protein